MANDGRWRFYAAEISYFSGKPRPALRYKHVPFDEILPTPRAYREVIRPRRVEPDPRARDARGRDAAGLERDPRRARAPLPRSAALPTTPRQRMLGYLPRSTTTSSCSLPGVHYRWSYEESKTKALPTSRRATAGPMRDEFAEGVKGFTRMMGVSPETRPRSRRTRRNSSRRSMRTRRRSRTCWRTPVARRLRVDWRLYPHLYLDAVPSGSFAARAARVPLIGARTTPIRSFGAWLDGDASPPTMGPIVELIGRDAVPFILDCAVAFERWADETSMRDGFLPRIVGMHQTKLRGVAFERITTPYTMWMVQRVTDAYRALPTAGRAAVVPSSPAPASRASARRAALARAAESGRRCWCSMIDAAALRDVLTRGSAGAPRARVGRRRSHSSSAGPRGASRPSTGHRVEASDGARPS